MMRVPTLSPPGHPGGIALSDSEKAEALADSLENQFQPMTDPSVSAVIMMVDVELGSYFMAPVREPKLTNPEEVQEAVRGLVSKALKHLPQRAIFHLVLIFNAILLTHLFPTAWKHASDFYTETGEDPALPSSYRPISLLDTIGKIFEKILLARMLMK